MSFSLIDCWKTLHGTELRDTLLRFAFEFIDKLCTLVTIYSPSLNSPKATANYRLYSQEGTDYEHIYHHHLHQFPKLVDQYPQLYEPEENQEIQVRATENYILPTIILFILLGNSDTYISQKVRDFRRLLPAGRLDHTSPLFGMKNISHTAAWRFINSLMNDSNPTSAELALTYLPPILRCWSLSPDLNEACLLARPFAYAVTGNHELLAFARRTCAAMQKFREHYAKVQHGRLVLS